MDDSQNIQEYYVDNEIAITQEMREKYIEPRKMLKNTRGICGYCHYHDMELTINKLRKKKCLCKENTGNTCRHLEKYNHEYWTIKEDIKALKKLK